MTKPTPPRLSPIEYNVLVTLAHQAHGEARWVTASRLPGWRNRRALTRLAKKGYVEVTDNWWYKPKVDELHRYREWVSSRPHRDPDPGADHTPPASG